MIRTSLEREGQGWILALWSTQTPQPKWSAIWPHKTQSCQAPVCIINAPEVGNVWLCMTVLPSNICYPKWCFRHSSILGFPESGPVENLFINISTHYLFFPWYHFIIRVYIHVTLWYLTLTTRLKEHFHCARLMLVSASRNSHGTFNFSNTLSISCLEWPLVTHSTPIY